MKIARPTVTEERWLVLADRYAGLRALVEKAGRTGGWKTTTWLGRCLGFVLGLIAAGMLAGALLPAPSPLLCAGVLLVIVAEWLVAQRRVFRSGIEEAIYLCGALAVVAQLLAWNPGVGEAVDVAVAATAVLLVGWRLLNPLFTTLAAALYGISLAMTGGSLLGQHWHALQAALWSAAIAVAAVLAQGVTWRRPSHARMVDGLVITMPWLAYGWLVVDQQLDVHTARWAALMLALAFLLATLWTGLRRRQHAPLIGALGNLLCFAHALHRLLPWPVHWQLIAAGAVTLLVAVLLDRRLRRRDGITSRVLPEADGVELAQLAGAAHIAPLPAAAPAGLHGQGGEFGGGGASGRF